MRQGSQSPHTLLPPGSVIGIFGGGQLGRMLAIAARAMDYRTVSLDPAVDCPAAQVCDHHIAAPYDDFDAASELASRADVVTYEFENVDAAAIEHIARSTEVLPSPSVLRITQDREIEKSTLRKLGIPVPDFRIVADESEARSAVRDIGVPVVMKTTRWGYDGKGQAVARRPEDASDAFAELTSYASATNVIVESLIPFASEISVIAARDCNGEIRTFPPSENIHTDSILDLSIVPARVSDAVISKARDIARGIASGFDVMGLIAVEMFVTVDGEVLVNETAPRPHNSGHYSIEGCDTSQFEQLVRVLTGMPMGETTLLTPCAMANLLGDIWIDARDEPDWSAALATPGAHLHLYGKAEARRGRKMGHVTAVSQDADSAVDSATKARQALL